MTQKKLSKEECLYLKGLAHHLKPTILVGDKGITESLLKECQSSILHHELMKIRISSADREARQVLMNELAASLNATIIQKIGHILTVYKRNHANPKILFQARK